MAHYTERCTTAASPITVRCSELARTPPGINCSTFSGDLPGTVKSLLPDLLRAAMALCTEQQLAVAQGDLARYSSSGPTGSITRFSTASCRVTGMYPPR